MDRYELEAIRQAHLSTANSIEEQLRQIKQQPSVIDQLRKSMGGINLNLIADQHTSGLVKFITEGGYTQIVERQSKLIELPPGLDLSETLNNLQNKMLELAINKNFVSLNSINKISLRTALVQSILPEINLDKITRSFDLSIDTRNTVFNSFSALLSSYSNLTQSLDQLIVDTPSVKIVSERPALELLNSAELLKSISVDNVENEIEEEGEFLKNEGLAEEENIEEALAKQGLEELIEMWQGAESALESKHPDYGRHSTVSWRELLTHLIHRLAPDEKIKAWSDDPIHFHDKKPTRKARLLYICRSVNDESFSRFIEKDIAALIEFINLFQAGTHAAKTVYTHKQLLTLKSRAKSTINYLIEISQLND